MCTIKDIRDSCFEGIDQRTFKDLLSVDDYKALENLGFESFLGLQKREVVEYLVEKVGKITKYIPLKAV
ncbi:hypothetical protein [Emticicia sp. BO119]|uniref:hypothetical protein n=1 Tax=Emticicia sp. BO119 TaxID=2757768 RepID=UPI0015F0FF22|nr:hypothetical protein [Emticicia sp. BO119]MBA4849014.1 hypothetical protein [Emticicia sp. BO119]